MKYILATEVNENGNLVFGKIRKGNAYMYYAKAEDGTILAVTKDEIIAKADLILNVRVSGNKIYPTASAQDVEHNRVGKAKKKEDTEINNVCGLSYTQLQKRHQKEVNEFPKFFAFSEKQFDEGMRQLGLDPSQTNMVTAFPMGCIVRDSDVPAWIQLHKRHKKEMQEAIKLDKTGDGFIYQMFMSELQNHEYSYTGDVSDTLEALNLTLDKVMKNPRLAYGLKKACDKIDSMEC